MHPGSRTQPIILITAIIFLIMLIVVLVFFLITSECSSFNVNLPINNDSKIDSKNLQNVNESKIRIITRDEWFAQPPVNELIDLELPSEKVIVAHTVTERCHTMASCVISVRLIQTFHIESGNFDDIAYNFLIGGDGNIYVGRGWYKQGAHTRNYNEKSICIAFIGTFIQNEPNEKQLKAGQLIIEEGVRLGILKSDYKLYGQRQLLATESPGEALYKIIQKWPHWSDNIE